MQTPIRKKGDGITIEVRLTPRASAEKITGVAGGRLQVRVASPPVEGKANKALISLLAKCLKVPKSGISIPKGQSSRDKVVAVSGISESEARSRLGEFLA